MAKVRTLTTCPTCKVRVRSDRLLRHRRKVHGYGRTKPRRGRDGLTEMERPVVYGVFIDETTDPFDRCAATTREGKRCSRSVAVITPRAGYCNQHFNSRG